MEPENRKAEVVVQEGQEAVLSCRAVGYPDPRIRWYHGNQVVHLYDNHYELSLEDVKMGDAGQWRCQVSSECNELGARELRFLFQLVVSSTYLSRRLRSHTGKRRVLLLAERTLFQ